jgi:hypothetical protein
MTLCNFYTSSYYGHRQVLISTGYCSSMNKDAPLVGWTIRDALIVGERLLLTLIRMDGACKTSSTLSRYIFFNGLK